MSSRRDVLQGALAEPQPAERLFVPAHRLFVAGAAADELPGLPRHRPGRQALEIAEAHGAPGGFGSARWSRARDVGRICGACLQGRGPRRARGHEERLPACDVRHAMSLRSARRADRPERFLGSGMRAYEFLASIFRTTCST